MSRFCSVKYFRISAPTPFKKLTQIAYESGYYDQSHFIKEFQFFTEKSPRQLQKSIQNVQKKVIIGVK